MPKIPTEIIYMQVAYQFAKLSYAERRKVGCVIVKDKQVISFGYNGTPHGCYTIMLSQCFSDTEGDVVLSVLSASRKFEGRKLAMDQI